MPNASPMSQLMVTVMVALPAGFAVGWDFSAPRGANNSIPYMIYCVAGAVDQGGTGHAEAGASDAERSRLWRAEEGSDVGPVQAGRGSDHPPARHRIRDLGDAGAR